MAGARSWLISIGRSVRPPVVSPALPGVATPTLSAPRWSRAANPVTRQGRGGMLPLALRWPRYRGPRQRDQAELRAAGEGAERSREGNAALAHVGSPPGVRGRADPRRGHPGHGGDLVLVPVPAVGL